MQPLYKEGVIAVIKMAREIQIVLFMFILVSFLIVSFTIQGNRATEKCTVGGKTINGRTDVLLLVIRKIFYLASASMRTLTGEYVCSAGKS